MLDKQVWIIKHWTLNNTRGKLTHLFFFAQCLRVPWQDYPTGHLVILTKHNYAPSHEFNFIYLWPNWISEVHYSIWNSLQEFAHTHLLLLLLRNKDIVFQRPSSILTEQRKDNIKEWTWSIKEWYSCVFWSCWPLLVSVHYYLLILLVASHCFMQNWDVTYDDVPMWTNQ